MKPLVFYFSFYLEETEEELTKGFIVDNPLPFYEKMKGKKFEDIEEILYDKITEKIESKFGVHDWSSSPNKNVDAIGYTTYEVEQKNIDKLMDIWHNEFIKRGADCSKIVDIKNNGDDFDIYNDIKTQLNQKKLKL